VIHYVTVFWFVTTSNLMAEYDASETRADSITRIDVSRLSAAV
jgi:hypothetical protein